MATPEYYFAYGSNMDAEQMQSRIPSARKVGLGVLFDYEIVFNRRGSYRPGGVASIQAAAEQEVHGVIWALSLSDLRNLDQIERPEAYFRSLRIIAGDNQEHRCYVYEAFPQGEFLPDEDYLDRKSTRLNS